MNPLHAYFVLVTREFIRRLGNLALVGLCLMQLVGKLRWAYGPR